MHKLFKLKDLFVPKDGGGGEGKERKMSNSSTGTMKTKWIKAFKSLKASDTPSSNSLPPTSPPKRYTFSNTVLSVMALSGPPEPTPYDQRIARYLRKNQRDKEKDAAATFESAHVFQEYTYKKITACDICHQILRGHSRQGLKCRLCKMNVHSDCMGQVARCQPKSRLLRRQRSTSEIETKHIEAGEEENKTGKAEEVDLIYQVLKQAGDLGGRRSTHGSMERDLGRDLGGSAASSGSGSATSLHRRHPRPTNTGATLTVNPAPVASCSGRAAGAAAATGTTTTAAAAAAGAGGGTAAVVGAEAQASTGVLAQDVGTSAASLRRRLFGKKKSQSEGMEPPERNGIKC